MLVQEYKKNPNKAKKMMMSLINLCSYEIDKLKIDKNSGEYYKYYEQHIKEQDLLNSLVVTGSSVELNELPIDHDKLFTIALVNRYKRSIPLVSQQILEFSTA